MKILSRKLTAHVEDYGYGEGPELGGWWCSGWDDTIFAEHLAELWDIPPEVRMIWISLHTTKAANRVAVRVDVDNYYGTCDMLWLVLDKGENKVGCGRWGENKLDKYLKKWAGKQLWIEVEYQGV